MNGWLTAEQAGEYLQLSPHTIRRWVSQRVLKAYQGPGETKGALRFRQEDLDAALQPLEPLTEGEVAASA